MTTLRYHEQFSHTTRTFDRLTPVDDNLMLKINELIEVNKHEFKIIKLITDKETIEQIFQVSDVPNQSTDGVPYNKVRKNSQLLAPLLIMLSAHTDSGWTLTDGLSSSYIVGKTYGQIGMAAVKAGYHTSFCICYDRVAAQEIIFKGDEANSYTLLANSVFMGIGKIAPGTVPQDDIRQDYVIPSIPKAHRGYITVIE
jgi:hypothetical protein